jgi:hypothetical protein
MDSARAKKQKTSTSLLEVIVTNIIEFPQQTQAGTGKIPTAFLQKKLAITVKPGFKFLLPPLSEEEYKGLENSILEEGCREPILLWDNVIIDGHNRYEICCKHDVRFNTKDTVFRNEKQARIWIYRNQLEKRNLKDVDRIKVAMALSEELEEKAREVSTNNLKQFQSGDNEKSTECWVPNTRKNETPQESQNRRNKNRVNAQLADLAGVSTDKVFRYKEILEHGTPEEIAEVESSEAKICPTYDKMVARSRKETSAVSFPQEKYRVVYSDFYERDDSILGWTPKRKTLDIRNIPVKQFLSDQAICFLWSPPNYLIETLLVMKNWGFKFVTSFVAEGEPFIDSHNSLDHMHVLVGEKNGCIPDVKKHVSSVLDKQKYGKDRYVKFRHLIEELYTEGNKIELFPEHKTLGWDKYQEQKNTI